VNGGSRVTGLIKRRERLARFGYSLSDSLPIASVKTRLTCERRECSRIVSAVTHTLHGLRTKSDGVFGPRKKTAAITDLGLFPAPDHYERAVSKETTGKYHRSANKARRAGLFVRRIRPGAYGQSLYDIKASKLLRSHGIVPEAAGIGNRPIADIRLDPTPPECFEHWRADWGLFSNADERMWGFASLIRAGNVVLMDHIMCHADVLNAGGMKLLHFEIMTELLERSSTTVLGIDYLVHGAIEDGGIGAVDWRRYVHQRPYIVDLPRSEAIRLPEDFNAAEYLRLNPDVHAAGADPTRHYLNHGMLEGRQYRIAEPQW
jgi:hypothetical protein